MYILYMKTSVEGDDSMRK